MVYWGELQTSGRALLQTAPAVAPELEVQMRPQSTSLVRPCEHCGSSVRTTAERLATGRGRYCSRRCANLAAHRDGRMRTPSRWPVRTVAERFEDYVDRSGACWVWRGAVDNGYGAFNDGSGRHIRAHQVAYELASGETIPDGRAVLHTCDNQLCVRNDDSGTYKVDGLTLPRFGHLALGVNLNNRRDAVAKGRQARGEKHGQARLTAAEVQTIRQRLAAGESQRAIATDVGLARQTVGDIATGRRWGWLAPSHNAVEVEGRYDEETHG